MAISGRLVPAVLIGLGLLATGSGQAATAMGDEEMAGIAGEGMVFAWTDFRMLFDPSSYLEQAGSASSNTCTATGNVAANENCWRRGDLRWYGLSVSGTGTAVGLAASAGAWNTTWTASGGNMTQCASAGINGLGCPVGGPIALFAAHDNPYVLRVMDYAGDGSAATAIGNGIVTYQGNTAAALWSNGAGSGSAQTVLEWLAPTQQDPYRFSFWGEIEVGRGGTGSGLLKSQTIIQGNAAGSILRFFKFTQTSTSPGLASAYDPTLGAAGCTDTGCPGVDGAGSSYNNRTLGIQYVSHLKGDFRFSVAQTGTTSDALGTPVAFDANEGMYFRNDDVYLPLGQPFYQALTINVPRDTTTNAPVANGNFTLEIPILPNRTAVFTRFYSLLNSSQVATGTASVPNAWDYGYATARSAYLYSLPVTTVAAAYMPAITGASVAGYPVVDANYASTHGYARWGDWSICQGVGCRLPLSANTVAQANAGTGRNSWNSSGDGVFFWGTSAYNAYSYSTTAMDVRTGNNQYTTVAYMSNFAACTPSGAADYTTCGYGGAYQGASSFGKSVSSVSMVPPENSFLNSMATGMGSSASRNVIAVPANSALNIGDSRIEGLQINYLRFASYGANYP